MKKLQILIVAIFALTLSLQGESLPYDYIDNSTPNITKDNVEAVAKYNAMIRKQQKESDGFFLGIGGTIGKPFGGIRKIRTDTKYYTDGLTVIPKYYHNQYISNAIDGGIETMLGYKWFFGGGTFGIRLYFDYNVRFLEVISTTPINITSHNFTLLNFDMLLNFAKTKSFKFGMILGFGYGLVYERVNKEYCKYFENCDILGETIQGNFGFRFVIYDNYAIEVLAQPRYSGEIFASMRNNNSYGDLDLYPKPDEVLNKVSEFAIMGTLRFVYTF